METQLKTTTVAKPFIDRTSKHEHFTSVNVTRNYDMFNLMFDNRDVNELHLKRLITSFRQKHLICPIIVNEKMQVIDGQHRLLASKATGMPVYYIIIKNYGIDEVSILNSNQKNWTKGDFLNMYAEEGVEAYKVMKKFMDDFPDFTIAVAERILICRASSKMSNDNDEKVKMKDFQEGKLVIPDIARAYKMGRKIMDFKPFYPNGFTRRDFIVALIQLLNWKGYDHKEMVSKLGGHVKLEDCSTALAYRELLEKIYNYKRQHQNKVSFRYLNNHK